METEQRLLERITKGDRKAPEELYRRLAGTAMAVAMRYVADEHNARDVLQEAFVKILTRVDRFEYRGEGSLKAWVMRVVSNEAVDWMRENSRYVVEPPSDSADLLEAEEEEPDVGSVPIEVLQRLIEQLPTGYRMVFNLYVMERKSHKEIARLLGIKENSSASQLYRARQMLAQQINDYKNKQQT